jgi:hypothetical protein
MADGWRVTQSLYDPSRHRWTVTAQSPNRGRRPPPEFVFGEGEDERAAVADLAERLGIAFLDVWVRQVGSDGDPGLQEVALDGPDTTSRSDGDRNKAGDRDKSGDRDMSSERDN